MSNSKVTKILEIHLKSNFKGQPFMDHEVHSVALEDDLSYTLSIKPRMNLATRQVIKKTEVNEVTYVQVFSNVDGRTYWHFDVYVYAEVTATKPMDEFMKFWQDEVQIKAMAELKSQNQMIKEMYKGIESLIS